MATTPDENPDSLPEGPGTDVEQVTPPDGNGRDDMRGRRADPAPDSDGADGGTSGTGGTSHRQGHDVTS